MDADLDLLLTVVYAIADDFLPKRAGNARRQVTDAEIITLSVAPAITGIRPIHSSSRPREPVLGDCSCVCPDGTRFTSAGYGSPTRSKH